MQSVRGGLLQWRQLEKAEHEEATPARGVGGTREDPCSWPKHLSLASCGIRCTDQMPCPSSSAEDFKLGAALCAQQELGRAPGEPPQHVDWALLALSPSRGLGGLHISPPARETRAGKLRRTGSYTVATALDQLPELLPCSSSPSTGETNRASPHPCQSPLTAHASPPATSSPQALMQAPGKGDKGKKRKSPETSSEATPSSGSRRRGQKSRRRASDESPAGGQGEPSIQSQAPVQSVVVPHFAETLSELRGLLGIAAGAATGMSMLSRVDRADLPSSSQIEGSATGAPPERAQGATSTSQAAQRGVQGQRGADFAFFESEQRIPPPSSPHPGASQPNPQRSASPSLDSAESSPRLLSPSVLGPVETEEQLARILFAWHAGTLSAETRAPGGQHVLPGASADSVQYAPSAAAQNAVAVAAAAAHREAQEQAPAAIASLPAPGTHGVGSIGADQPGVQTPSLEAGDASGCEEASDWLALLLQQGDEGEP